MKPKKKYTWNAEDYSKNSSAQQEWANELISKLNLEGNESILDIGCGDGKITFEIANRLHEGKIVGVDSSKEMIHLATKSFQSGRCSNLSFKHCDARNLPFNNEFDIVFSNAALHWVKDHRPIIQGISDSLKPNGRVLLQMGGKGNAQSILTILETMIAEKQWNDYFSDFEFPYGFHDPQSYQSWLMGSGLNLIRAELIPKDMTYDDPNGLAGWIRTTWLPYTDRVPAQRKTEFINQLVDKYIEANPLDSNGIVHVDMVRLEVEAMKNECP